MTDYLLAVFEFPSGWQPLTRAGVAWAVPAALLLLALWLLYPWYRHTLAIRRVRTNLRRLGRSALGDVTLDNGMEGFAFIDYLVLTPREILVVTLADMQGIIFGGEKIDSWARVVQRRTFKFPNPVAANEERVLVVKYHVPDVAIRGVVLFDEGCVFPKGKPAGVLLPQEIVPESQQQEASPIAPALQAAWSKLEDLARQGSEAYGSDVVLMRGGESHIREIAAIVLCILALLWSGWRLFA